MFTHPGGVQLPHPRCNRLQLLSSWGLVATAKLFPKVPLQAAQVA